MLPENLLSLFAILATFPPVTEVRKGPVVSVLDNKLALNIQASDDRDTLYSFLGDVGGTVQNTADELLAGELLSTKANKIAKDHDMEGMRMKRQEMTEGCNWGSATVLRLVYIATLAQSLIGEGRASDVPMTRPGECLAVIDGIGSSAAYVELTDGRILVYSGGFRTSSDGGLTWSQPLSAPGIQEYSLRGDSNLIHLSGSGLGFIDRMRSGDGEPECLYFWRSEDEGKTWQKPVRIGDRTGFVVAALNNAIIRTSSGRIILPVYGVLGPGEDDWEKRDPFRLRRVVGGLRGNQWVYTGAHHFDPLWGWCFVYYSDDDGRTWKPTSIKNAIYLWDANTVTWSMAAEPSVVEVTPGKLLMLMRTHVSRIYKAWSYDNGENWTIAMPTPLAASNAPAKIAKVPATGDLVAVWTQVSQAEIRRGLIRARLSSAVSRNEGAVWEHFQNVESFLEGVRIAPGPIQFVRPEEVYFDASQPAATWNAESIAEIPDENGRFSYPGVFFYKDRVLISHTNAHHTKAGKWVGPGRIRVLPVAWLYGSPENMRPNQELKKIFPPRP